MRYVVVWDEETNRWMVWDRDRACVAGRADSRDQAKAECQRLNAATTNH